MYDRKIINKTNIGSLQRLVKLIARLIKKRHYQYQNDRKPLYNLVSLHSPNYEIREDITFILLPPGHIELRETQYSQRE